MNYASWALSLTLLSAVVTACQSGASAQSGSASAEPHPSAAPATNVLIVADLGEADEPCVCGEVIRAVRAAAAGGIKVREVDARNAQDKRVVAREYRILVSPAILFLDDRGREVSRVEGESRDAVRAVRTGLAQLAKR